MMVGPLAEIAIDSLRLAYDRLGYKFFDAGALNLNLFGVRSGARKAGKFDDTIGVAYRDIAGRWVLRCWEATTDPFAHYLKNPINAKGCAVLVPGQYLGAYKVGVHRGQHDALVQRGAPVRVWRDNNRDAILDWKEDEPGESGWFGINIHRPTSSAGCQMFKNWRELEFLLSVCRASTAAGRGEFFTYTLLTEAQLSL